MRQIKIMTVIFHFKVTLQFSKFTEYTADEDQNYEVLEVFEGEQRNVYYNT